MNGVSLFFLGEVLADALHRENSFKHKTKHCLFDLSPPSCLEYVMYFLYRTGVTLRVMEILEFFLWKQISDMF